MTCLKVEISQAVFDLQVHSLAIFMHLKATLNKIYINYSQAQLQKETFQVWQENPYIR